MGLDGVELLLAVEDRFGIVIADDEGAQVTTVGDLHQLVVSKMTPQGSKACLSSHAFYALRSGLREVAGCSRGRVSPEASLEDLLPVEGRRSTWDALSRYLGWHLPRLRLPAALEWGIVAGCLGAIPVAMVIGKLGLVALPVAWAIGLGAIPALWVSLRVAEPLAVQLPGELGTVGSPVKEVLSLNFGVISEESQSWNESEVWQALHATVVEQLGCRPADVSKGARCVEDLGLG